jgi:hypothetical protein
MIHSSLYINDVVEYYFIRDPNIRRVTLRELSVVVLPEGEHAIVLCLVR